MKKIEVHINTRGCKKPMDPKTARALAVLFKVAARELAKRVKKNN